MVFAVQAELAFRNVSRRDTISSTIQARIAQDTPWGEVNRADYITRAGDAAVQFEVRFLTLAAADAFWADVQTQVGTGVNGPLVGSTLYRHDCPHDQPAPAPCVVSTRVNF